MLYFIFLKAEISQVGITFEKKNSSKTNSECTNTNSLTGAQVQSLWKSINSSGTF